MLFANNSQGFTQRIPRVSVRCYYTGGNKTHSQTTLNTMSSGLRVKRIVEYETLVPDLAQRIQQARKAAKKPLTKICEEAGVSRSYWYQLESERIDGAISEEILRKVEKALGVDLEVDFKEIVAS